MKNAPVHINFRSTLAFRGLDSGHSAMKDWFGTMNMSSVLSKNAYASANNKLEEAASRTFDVVSQTTRKLMKEAYTQIGVTEDKDEIFDVAVSYDWTWQKLGHTSHNGAACTIDLLIGLPIDIEVLSNYCAKCSTTPDDIKNQEWLENHATVCSKNFNWISRAMEVEATVRLWKRSIKKCNVRYTKCKAFLVLETLKELSLFTNTGAYDHKNLGSAKILLTGEKIYSQCSY